MYTRQPRGSQEYFREIEQQRYKYHYHLPDQFQRISRKGVAGKRMLEIGCGIGIDAMSLARLEFAEVVGLDLTEQGVRLATERASADGIENLRFVVGDGENLDFEDSSFDFVYSFGVIHHTPRIEKAVAEIHRVLKPSGCAFVMIYHSRSLVELLHRLLRQPYEKLNSRSGEAGDAPVVIRSTRGEAEELFSGFERVELQADYPFTYGLRFVSALVPVSAQRWLGRRIGWHLMVEAQKGAH